MIYQIANLADLAGGECYITQERTDGPVTYHAKDPKTGQELEPVVVERAVDVHTMVSIAGFFEEPDTSFWKDTHRILTTPAAQSIYIEMVAEMLLHKLAEVKRNNPEDYNSVPSVNAAMFNVSERTFGAAARLLLDKELIREANGRLHNDGYRLLYITRAGQSSLDEAKKGEERRMANFSAYFSDRVEELGFRIANALDVAKGSTGEKRFFVGIDNYLDDTEPGVVGVYPLNGLGPQVWPEASLLHLKGRDVKLLPTVKRLYLEAYTNFNTGVDDWLRMNCYRLNDAAQELYHQAVERIIMMRLTQVMKDSPNTYRRIASIGAGLISPDDDPEVAVPPQTFRDAIKDLRDNGRIIEEQEGHEDDGLRYIYLPDKELDTDELKTALAASIDDLRAKGEGQYIEFKADIFGPEPKVKDHNEAQNIVQEALGFINQYGGVILIGVTNEGEVVGIEDGYERAKGRRYVQDEYDMALRQKLSSKVGARFYLIKFETVQGKVVCRIEVQASPDRPVYYEEEHLYVREGSMTKRMSAKKANDHIHTRWPEFEL